MVEEPDAAPPARQACSLIGNSSSSLAVPAFSASNSMVSVISLDMLAGCIWASAFFSHRTAPVSESTRMPNSAEVSKAKAGRAANPTISISANATDRRMVRVGVDPDIAETLFKSIEAYTNEIMLLFDDDAGTGISSIGDGFE